MIDFKGSHFEKEIILWGVRWYVAYPISYRQLEEMMQERGVAVDHSTLNRWVIKYAPEFEKAFRRRRPPVGKSWRLDETYVRVKGEWKYLYRAVDKEGQTVDFLLTPQRDRAAAKAFLRGIERRIEAGLKPEVGSVASVFISRWDTSVMDKVPDTLRDKLGIAIAKRTYKAYRDLLGSPRWQRSYNAGARPQRLLWASTGTKDPQASDVLYIKALAAPFTVNTMPEGTLKALADHGDLSEIMSADGGDCEAVLDQFAKADVDVDALAARLQAEGAKSFVNSWNELMHVIASKSATLAQAR